MDTIEATLEAVAKEVARARRLLARLVRVAGYTRAKVDKRLHQGRGFSTRILTGKVDLKHEQILLILKAIEVDPEDFYRILYRRPEDRSNNSGTLSRLLEKMSPFDESLDDEEDEEEPEVAPPATPGAFDMDQFAIQIAEKVLASLRPQPPAGEPEPADEPQPPSAGEPQPPAAAVDDPQPPADGAP